MTLDEERLLAERSCLLDQFERFAREFYGPRCSTDDKDCVTCQVWAAYDDLLAATG